MEAIDRKFLIQAVNPVNGKRYTEKNSLLLCAKDQAVPAAIFAYKLECERIGANPEHVRSVELLYNRVKDFQAEAGGGRVPDTVGAEIARCLTGAGIKEASNSGCVWSADCAGSDTFNTSCGKSFRLDDGPPLENDMKFCSFCGHPIIEVLPLTDTEWEELAESGEHERADLFERTMDEDEHPEDYDGPCMCRECRSYGE